MTESSRLSGVLRAPDRAGVYHLPAEGCEGVAQVAAELGFAFAHVELDGCPDKAEFLHRIAAALHFPTWFGQNWDALADCLTDLSWLKAEGYVLVLDHMDRLRLAAEADFVTAIDIFEEAARSWADEGVPMWIFVGLAQDGITHLRSL
ncbi:MAG TPA: barstar family protein [Aromatoleum sp.]|uniref:barstar family protein n=1 Tax=Aromatoleum sp. TaxID=2307007 RepID=UPI002B463967|nr:barstar family protein [Aromatoleum sp.]HJV28315.1 barstar family protein [Aromatoleum sp.]